MPYENLSTKYKEIIALDNRRKVYELVRENPGLHFREIERKSKIPYGTLKYHLNFLVKKDLLVEKKYENNARYFSKEFSPDDFPILSLLRQKSIRKILLFLISSKNCAHSDIASFTKLSPSTVSWHLSKLIRKGVIEKTSIKPIIYRLRVDKDDIIKLLISYKESFLDSLVDKTIEMWDVK
ncbi:MAG: winged helix-turn-helix transcriptional regulator [Nanoarchaeota archaeon]